MKEQITQMIMVFLERVGLMDEIMKCYPDNDGNIIIPKELIDKIKNYK